MSVGTEWESHGVGQGTKEQLPEQRLGLYTKSCRANQSKKGERRLRWWARDSQSLLVLGGEGFCSRVEGKLGRTYNQLPLWPLARPERPSRSLGQTRTKLRALAGELPPDESGQPGQRQGSVPGGGCPLSLRGTHVALTHEQVLGGGLGSCAAQVRAPAELLLLVT